jgi:signal transduction histidine kinase
MGISPLRQSICRWLLPIVVGLAGVLTTVPALAQPQPPAPDRQTEVLVLYSTRRDAPMSTVGDRELPRLLDAGLAPGWAYYAEYMDLGRFPGAGYQATFSEFLRVKYKGRRFDLVIAIQDAAVEFVQQHRAGLFPDTPVVFLATTPPKHRIANSTGAIAEPHLGGTVELALQLDPDLRHVFVVSGAAQADKRYETLARAQLRSFESRLTVTYLTGLATRDLEVRLATLPAHSIVYYLTVYQDGAGDLFTPSAYLERVASIARAPTYSWIDTSMGRGILGGSLLDATEIIGAVARLALRVLGGEPADSIPIASLDLHVNQVDWRRMQHWGISEARIPAGTILRFREPSLWYQYRAYILGAVAIVLAQAALIVGLLVQRARRRQAEETVRGRDAALHTSRERIRDLASRLLDAQEAERTHIARELHDDIGQQVALLAIDLELLGRAVPGQDQAGRLSQEALIRTRALAGSVHDLSHRLHPAKLRLIGLAAALRGLVNELPQSDLTVTFTHEDLPSALPADLTLCLYRIAQEAVQNALKYSGARELSVHLAGGSGRVTLTMVDNGVGFDVEQSWGRGLGLVSMAERVEPLGGALTIRSAPGAGTRLEVTVPLRVDDNQDSVAV